MDTARAHQEFALSIDIQSREVTELSEVGLSDIGIKERQDLQRWVEDHPEMVGPDLLLVTTEFDRWELRQVKVADRLDVLFLDSDGHPLVAELKRGDASDTVELQALKYAAYCSSLRAEELVDEYASYHKVSLDAARETVFDHAPSLAESEPGPVRVQLLAASFGPAVTSVVMWLNEFGLEIGCIEIKVRRFSEEKAVLVARQIIPPPDAADFFVRRRKREEAEEVKEAAGRQRNAVTLINEGGTIPAGTEISLVPQAFTDVQRPTVEKLIAENPEYGRAVWTGRGSHNAIEWELDGETYSVSGLIAHMLDEQGLYRTGVRGPNYWCTPDGRTLNEVAESIDAATLNVDSP